MRALFDAPESQKTNENNQKTDAADSTAQTNGHGNIIDGLKGTADKVITSLASVKRDLAPKRYHHGVEIGSSELKDGLEGNIVADQVIALLVSGKYDEAMQMIDAPENKKYADNFVHLTKESPPVIWGGGGSVAIKVTPYSVDVCAQEMEDDKHLVYIPSSSHPDDLDGYCAYDSLYNGTRLLSIDELRCVDKIAPFYAGWLKCRFVPDFELGLPDSLYTFVIIIDPDIESLDLDDKRHTVMEAVEWAEAEEN